MALKNKYAYDNKLIRAMKQDPKKAVVLSVLVIVMLVLWGKMMLKGGSGPQTAIAATSAITSDNQLNDARLQQQADAANASMQEWVRGPISPLARNLFAVKLDYFPQDGARVNQALLSPQGDGFWDELAKSMTVRADQKKERQILVENLQLQAAQLRLQTIMMGASPKALINGGLVGEGDVVASFRVRKIEARRVIVEREGIKLAIVMN